MAKKSFSQYGQDIYAEATMLAKGIVPREKGYVGTYVDVGCCWPVNGSNTYNFYALGWRGICIDANPEMAELFAAERPEDTFVNCGIGDNGGSLTYYMYKNRQHNSFSPQRAERKADNLIGQLNVEIRGLSDILDEKLGGKKIDFLSMDIEGFEMSALRSIDFDRHRPSFICIESIIPMKSLFKDEVIIYLVDKGYELVGHSGHDAFLVNKRT